MNKFQLLLLFMAGRMQYLSHNSAGFMAMLHHRDFVIQLQTFDSQTVRYFSIKNRRIRSRAQAHLKPDFVLSFEDEARAGMELGAYFAEIKKGTAAAREQIAKSKYFPEDQIAKFEALRNDIKEAIHEVVSEGGMETNA